MNIIKFRAWDKNKKRMIYPCSLHIEITAGEVEKVELKTLKNNYPYAEPLLDYTLLQYTGLEDINKTEIYEGDIVQYELDDCCFSNGIIALQRGSFVIKDGHCLKPLWFDDDVRVLGNMFENMDSL